MQSRLVSVLDTVLGQAPVLDLNFASSKTLDSRITFSRGSSATQIGATGLVEYAPENLLLRSEEIDNASWSRSGVTITQNAGTSPDGATTAESVTATSTGSAIRFVIQSTAKAALTIQYAYSFWAKAVAGGRYITFSVDNGAGAGFSGGIDLSTGQTTGGTVGAGGAFTSVLATQFSNGWWKVVLVGTSTADITVRVAVNLAASLTIGFPVETLTAGDGVLLWGAQLERYSTARAYIPTTSAAVYGARFTHDPVTLASLGLLIEEPRTNLVLRSQQIQASPWGGTAVFSQNSATAPDGTSTASTVTTQQYFFQDCSGSNGTYTGSIWAKSSSGSFVTNLEIYNFASATKIAGVQITVTTTWTRFTVTGTTNAGAGAARLQISNVGGGVNPPVGSMWWGGQLEAGAFATSYIPTTSATATRAADVAAITGTNFSSWFNSLGGTLVAEGILGTTSGSRRMFTFGDSSVGVGTRVNGSASSIIWRTPTNYDASTGTVSAGAIKQAFSYAPSLLSGVVNGGTIATNTPPSSLPATYANVGSSETGFDYWNGTISRIRYYRRRLPDANLQTLTT